MDDLKLLAMTRDAIYVALKVSGPALILGLAIGSAVALVQSIVQVNEMTLTFVPKLLAILLSLVVAGPWLGAELVQFGQSTFSRLGAYGQVAGVPARP